MNKNLLAVALFALPFAAAPFASAWADKPARLKCGIVAEPLDWNKQDLHGNLAALDAEMCRAVARRHRHSDL
jgi:ABC-type amino acid transport substrate-binding protein